MKKKIVSLVMAMAMVLSLNLVAFADSDHTLTESSTQSATTNINTTLGAVYVVTIPSSVTVTANNTSDQTFGTVKLITDNSYMHVNGSITVSVASSAGVLTNSADSTDTIAFNLKKGTAAFTSGVLTKSSPSFDLLINVPDWTHKSAGDFSGSVNFNISYSSGV